MPRRRMIDPDFWSDGRVKHLTPTERLFFLGLISHADDEGRIQGNPTFLRSVIFPYDNFTLKQITKMRSHVLETNPNITLYENSGEEYLHFKKWARYQKPSHPQPSKLPKPPEQPELQESVQELKQEPVKELHQPQTGIIPSQSRLGQVSLGKVSIGKDRIGEYEGKGFTDIKNDKDLIDRLTDGLKKYLPQEAPGIGNVPLPTMDVVRRFWEEAMGANMTPALWAEVKGALEVSAVAGVAESLVKFKNFGSDKRDHPKYLRSILKDKCRKP